MPYSKEIESRIDDLIASWPNLEKKKMFGGVCYLTDGKMCFGIWQEHLIVRTGPEVAAQKLTEEGVRPFDVTGKAMKGWVMVATSGLAPGQLLDWLKLGHGFAGSLPGK